MVVGSATQKYIRRYQCGHWFWFGKTHLPKLGELTTCKTCGKVVEVIASDAHEFHAQCWQKNCKFVQYTGQAKELTFRAAIRHKRKYPNHLVRTFDPDGNLLHNFDGKNQISLDGYGKSLADETSDRPWS
jgi:hypothetical protein